VGGNGVFYLPNVSGVTVCNGSAYYGSTCEAKMGKDWRCTYDAANETGCNVQTVFTDIGAGASFNIVTSGDNKVIASVRCKAPLPTSLSLLNLTYLEFATKYLRFTHRQCALAHCRVGQQTASPAPRSQRSS